MMMGFEYTTKVQVATITLWNFGAILVHMIAFAVLSMKAQKNDVLKAFFSVQTAMVIWLFGKVCKTVSPNVELRWFFIVLYYFGICLLEISFFDFAYVYSKGKWLKRSVRLGLYGFGLLQFIVVATNPYHYLFYSEYGFWGDEFGPLFYVHMGFNYGFILAGMVLCGRTFKNRMKHRKRWERNLIFLAVLIPVVFNLIYISRTLEAFFDYLGIQVFDITPIVYTWSILVFIYATFKFDFFDISPFMKHEIMERLDTPILVMNGKGQVIYGNAKATLEFGSIDAAFHDLRQLSKMNDEDRFHFNNESYRIHRKRLSRWDGNGFILSLNNMTSYHLVELELAKENHKLEEANTKLEAQIEMLKETSRIGARNFVSRELHDIIGHSLVVSMRLLEVAKLTCNTSYDKAQESLKKAKETVENGFKEMKQIMDKKDASMYSTALLERDFKRMFKNLEHSGVKTNLYIRGTTSQLNEQVYDILKKVATELITNSLKHGEPSRILLSLHQSEAQVQLQYMDNGKGTNILVKGHGLKGMDDRLALVKGHAKHTTDEGEGFTSLISVPITS